MAMMSILIFGILMVATVMAAPASAEEFQSFRADFCSLVKEGGVIHNFSVKIKVPRPVDCAVRIGRLMGIDLGLTPDASVVLGTGDKQEGGSNKTLRPNLQLEVNGLKNVFLVLRFKW
jgi:hypothetical protein